jgi:hypothetical protein
MENNENFVAEQVTENVEQTTEETVVEPAKLFTQDEMNAAVGKAKARTRAKIEKEYQRKYGNLEEVLKAGTGKESVEEMTDTFTKFYESKGIKINKKPDYSARDVELLAKADADEIIRGGFEEVIEEADRLKEMGVENMTARDKAVFVALTNHIKNTETSRELSKLGVTEDVYNSNEFKDFAGKFNPNTPIKDIYDIYNKTRPKKEYKSMGSMKQAPEQGVKDYYSPEEIAKLTEDELRDPKVWEAVRRSMTSR